MPLPRHPARLALIAAITVIGAFGGAVPAGATPAPTPHLRLSWTVLRFRCWTATERVRVGHGRHIRAEKRRVRRCGDRPVTVHGRVLHLRWQQRAELFGHLTLARQPLANVPVTVAWTIASWGSGSEIVVTNADGRFSVPLSAPSMVVTVSCSPAPGVVLAVSRRIDAAARLSLHVGHLRAGRRARFSGTVYGGYLPADLYVQFSYLTSAGWQPFSHLAIVNRSTGRWAARIPIPDAAAGYRYEIRAAVVPSPDWPWADTASNVLTRIVSY